MTSDGIGGATHYNSAGGRTQPAGNIGRGDDRGVRGAGAVRAVVCATGPGADRSSGAADGTVGVALVRNGRIGARYSVANRLRGAGFDAGGYLRSGRIAYAGPDIRFNRGILRRISRPVSQRNCDECVHVVSGDSAGDCVRRVSGAGAGECDTGAVDWRVGRLRPTGESTGSGGTGAGVCGSGAGAGGERSAHYHPAHTAEYYSAGDCAGGDWDGGGDSGGGDA